MNRCASAGLVWPMKAREGTGSGGTRRCASRRGPAARRRAGGPSRAPSGPPPGPQDERPSAAPPPRQADQSSISRPWWPRRTSVCSGGGACRPGDRRRSVRACGWRRPYSRASASGTRATLPSPRSQPGHQPPGDRPRAASKRFPDPDVKVRRNRCATQTQRHRRDGRDGAVVDQVAQRRVEDG